MMRTRGELICQSVLTLKKDKSSVMGEFLSKILDEIEQNI